MMLRSWLASRRLGCRRLGCRRLVVVVLYSLVAVVVAHNSSRLLICS